MNAQVRELLETTAKRTLVAFVFGFILSACFAIAISLRIEPVLKLERESVDLGIRVADAVFRQTPEKIDLPERASPIVIVEIDKEACSALASANRCTFDRIVQPEVVAAAMEIIDAADPQVAILDMLVSPEAAGPLETAAGERGPPLLTAMELRQAEDAALGTQAYLLERTVCGNTRCGRLEYLPAMSLVQDGKTRYYPRSMPVSLLANLAADPQTAEPIPSIPWRAAQLGAPYELYDDGDPAPPIPFTISSFEFASGGAPISSDRRSQYRMAYEGEGAEGNISQFRLSELKPDAGSPVELDVPSGAILIIGSSQASGGDIHNTPLGPMGGMEVLANAIRGFQLAAPDQTPDALEAFWQKITAVLKALAVIAVIEGVLAYLALKREKAAAKGARTTTKGAFLDKWSVPIFLAMMAAFVGEFLLACWEIVSQIDSNAGSVGAVDVIWPILGVTLSALIGFASEILAKLEWLVERLFRYSPISPAGSSGDTGQ